MQRVAARAGPSAAYDTEIERRKRCFPEESFDDNIRQAAQHLAGPEFVALLEGLLEVPGLIPLTAMRALTSRSYFHVSSGGGFLGSHVDQSYVGRRFGRKYIHVCSCVFYGSPQWRTEYGGHTILFDRTGERAVTTVECKPNRTNIFLHTSTSFHGVSEMTTDNKRYSLYMDYYLPRGKLHLLQESIVRNHAKCGPDYWPHNVVFIPRSRDTVYAKVYQRYLAAASRPF